MTLWALCDVLVYHMEWLVWLNNNFISSLVRMTVVEKRDLCALGRNESYYLLEDNVEVSQKTKHRTTMWRISWPLGVHEGTGISNLHFLHRKKMYMSQLWLERRCVVFQWCSHLVSYLLFLDLASQKQQMSSSWTRFSRIHCHSHTDGWHLA